ncbi:MULTISPECIES: DUF6325 family protein [unclassified Plantibacter]|uniref:DUF6325 family protein n=1 Tax=unclassified Plantibacter TaxID=2624265 RepID=UPI003D33C6B4
MSPSITGPVELLAWHFPSVEDAIVGAGALEELQADPSIRIVDLILGTSEDGEIVFVEIGADGAESLTLVEVPEETRGLIAHQDVDQLASESELDDGSSVLVIAIEHVWAETLSEAMAAAGGTTAFDEFVPAAAIDEVLLLAVEGAE